MKWHIFLSFLLFIPSVYGETLEIKNAWIKPAPPVSKMSAAFMKIKNTGEKKRYLIKTEADFAKNVEIHTTTKKDGVMQMRPLKELLIPASSSVALKHGSHHIMFIGLKEELQEGEKRELTLIFKNGKKLTLNVPVKSKS